MGLDCCCRFLRIIVVVINILIVIVGIAALALGVVMFLSSNELEKTKEDGMKFLVIICATIIAVGAMLLIVGFIGCCGAVYENQCLLGTFIFFMAVALGVVIAGAILIGKHKEEITDGSGKIVEKIFKELVVQTKELTEVFQEKFQCCGSTTFEDWTKVNLDVPLSCCVEKDNKCNEKRNEKLLFRNGCKKVVKEWVESTINISPLILGLAGIAETLAIVTTLGLCCYIRKGAY